VKIVPLSKVENIDFERLVFTPDGRTKRALRESEAKRLSVN
jgi:hypothetical protein